MDLQDAWEKALRETDIIRFRKDILSTSKTEELSYIFLSESEVNLGDTVVRKGKVLVHEPSIILPKNCPQLEGFEFQKDLGVSEETIKSFLLVRGVSLPSFEYTNEIAGLDIYEGSLDSAVDHFLDQLERKEDIDTSLIIGPEDCWQFSILVFVAGMVSKSASSDVRKLFEDLRRKSGL